MNEDDMWVVGNWGQMGGSGTGNSLSIPIHDVCAKRRKTFMVKTNSSRRWEAGKFIKEEEILENWSA